MKRLLLAVLGLSLLGAGCVPAVSVPPPPAGWDTFTTSDGMFAFDYPASFGKTVWHPRSWPPQVTIVPPGKDPVKEGCPDIPDGTAPTTVTENGVPFTALTASDAGAGQLYDTSCYYATRGLSTYAVEIVIWSHLGCGAGECGAYCGTQYEEECKALDRETDIQKPVDAIAATFRFLK